VFPQRTLQHVFEVFIATHITIHRQGRNYMAVYVSKCSEHSDVRNFMDYMFIKHISYIYANELRSYPHSD